MTKLPPSMTHCRPFLKLKAYQVLILKTSPSYPNSQKR